MDYEVIANSVDIPGTRARGRENETIKIGTKVNEEADEIYRGLYQRTLSIPSFKGIDTTGFVQNETLSLEELVLVLIILFKRGNEVQRQRTYTNVRIKFGKGNESSYFEFFGLNPENTESAYEVSIGVLGFQQKFGKFPVAVMTDSDYDRLVNEWSSGEYVGGGIKIREPGSIKDSFTPVLAHEVVHGLNDRRLNWDQTSSSYFDEGVSKYVESLMRKKMYNEGETNRKPGELFGKKNRIQSQRKWSKIYLYSATKTV